MARHQPHAFAMHDPRRLDGATDLGEYIADHTRHALEAEREKRVDEAHDLCAPVDANHRLGMRDSLGREPRAFAAGQNKAVHAASTSGRSVSRAMRASYAPSVGATRSAGATQQLRMPSS